MSIRSLSDKVKKQPKEVIQMDSGATVCEPDVASALSLSSKKLLDIYNNQYMPKEINETISDTLTLKTFAVEVAGWEANAYTLIKNEKHLPANRLEPQGDWQAGKIKNCLLVDSAGASVELLKYIKEIKILPAALLITHGHFDHRGGVENIIKEFPGIKIVEAGKDISKDGKIEISGFTIEAFIAPGHSEDSVCYLVDKKVMFVGDTIFAGSVGKPNYDYQQLLDNIKQKIFTLPDAIILAPGHGPMTTVGEEKEHNPFFNF